MPTGHTLDLNAGLTQVLADGADAQHPTNTYLYGVDRIGELQPGGFLYHLTDALGSVRHLVDASGAVKLAESYEPYGSVLDTSGTASSAYGFVGEAQDSYTELLMLRSRWLRINAADSQRDVPVSENYGVVRLKLEVGRDGYHGLLA